MDIMKTFKYLDEIVTRTNTIAIFKPGKRKLTVKNKPNPFRQPMTLHDHRVYTRANEYKKLLDKAVRVYNSSNRQEKHYLYNRFVNFDYLIKTDKLYKEIYNVTPGELNKLKRHIKTYDPI